MEQRQIQATNIELFYQLEKSREDLPPEFHLQKLVEQSEAYEALLDRYPLSDIRILFMATDRPKVGLSIRLDTHIPAHQDILRRHLNNILADIIIEINNRIEDFRKNCC